MPERPVANLMEEFHDRRPVSLYRLWLLSLLTPDQQARWRGLPIEQLTSLTKHQYVGQGGTWH